MRYKSKRYVGLSTAWILRFTFGTMLFVMVLVLFMFSTDLALLQTPNETMVNKTMVKLTVEVRDSLLRIPINDVIVVAINVDNTSYRVPLSRVGDGVYEGYLPEGLYNISINDVIVAESLYLYRDTKLTISWSSGITQTIYSVVFLLLIFLPILVALAWMTKGEKEEKKAYKEEKAHNDEYTKHLE